MFVYYYVLCCSVPEFEASQYLVTNGEFLEFVESGGYQNKDLWTLEGMDNLLPRTEKCYPILL